MRRITRGRFVEDLLEAESLSRTPVRHIARAVAALEERWTSRPLFAYDLGRAGEEGIDKRLPYVVTVAGAYRGGSWKTPLAVALALEMAAKGKRVGLLGRGYRGADSAARLVATLDEAKRAGDEAFAAYPTLRGAGVRCLVAASSVPSALRLAADLDVVVVDGCRLRPPPGRGMALLATDGVSAGTTPWPAHPVLPVGLGTRLSPHGRLLVPVIDRCVRASPEGYGATYDVAFTPDVPHDRWQGRCIVVVTTHARPQRMVAALARRGIVPAVHLALADHADAATAKRALRSIDADAVVIAADKASLALADLVDPSRLWLVRCAITPSPALMQMLLARAESF